MLHQKEQLNNIESKTTKINQDLKTSQKHITNINSIFGGIKNWWSGDKDKDKNSKSGDSKAGSSKLQETVERNQASRPHPGERLRTDDGRGFYEEEEDLDSRFMKGAKGQNQYFKPVTNSKKEALMNENLGNIFMINFSLVYTHYRHGAIDLETFCFESRIQSCTLTCLLN